MSGIRIRYLSFFFGIISILSLLNVAFSYQLNLYQNLNTYYISFISSLSIGVAFYYFEKVIDINPLDLKALQNLGISYEKQGDLVKAELYFLKAMEYDRNCVDLIMNFANYYFRNGELEKAYNLFIKVC